jgi:predicted Zn-dependent peptidase
VSWEEDVTPARTANKIVLPSGLTILHERNPVSKAFCVGVWTRTGARDESVREVGLCHFLEHMLFKGTNRRSAKQISTDIEKVGGSLDAFTTKDTMCVYGQVLESKKDVAIDLIADMLTASRFAEEQVAMERKVVVEEIGDVDDAPEDLIHELFAAEVFPHHPLGRPILGYRKTVSSFRRNDLRRYARRAFRSSNLVVSVYGNIDVAELTKICATRFAFPRGTLARDGTRFPAPLARRRHVRRKLHQQHVCMGTRTFSFLVAPVPEDSRGDGARVQRLHLRRPLARHRHVRGVHGHQPEQRGPCYRSGDDGAGVDSQGWLDARRATRHQGPHQGTDSAGARDLDLAHDAPGAQ